MTAAPTLLIYLDDAFTGAVRWKAEGVKGARWKKAKSLADAERQAAAVLPPATDEAPWTIDYLSDFVEAM